ncbi:MAG: hypothetical protein HKN71_12775, partial [Gemmatimonadetes bacterium]|nr:hypothetical protein [Gemmatimonadota bacterium]
MPTSEPHAEQRHAHRRPPLDVSVSLDRKPSERGQRGAEPRHAGPRTAGDPIAPPTPAHVELQQRTRRLRDIVSDAGVATGPIPTERHPQAQPLIGYHASTTNPEGVRAHTLSSATLAAVRVNGVEMTEGALNALIAGHFGVPVVLVSGGDAATAEVADFVGEIEQATVKFAHGFHSTRTMTPAAGRAVIAERTTAALSRLDDFAPVSIEGPLELEVTFKNYMPAEVLAFLPWAERADAHTVRFRPADAIEMANILNFVT